MRDPNAVVYLVPGVGMFTFAKDKATARISGEFYVNAINVMRGASTVSTYRGLPEQEAFDIEYWLLEEAKLAAHAEAEIAGRPHRARHRRRRRHRPATAARLLGEGACVVLADIDETALSGRQRRTGQARSARTSSAPVKINVTKEDAVIAGFAEAGGRVRRPRHPRLQRRHRLLGADRGDDARAVEQEHGHPGDGLFPRRRAKPSGCSARRRSAATSSSSPARTALAASPNAAAYCTAKAAEIHLARCLALEGADEQIRVNSVNPDAVLRGSKIWAGEWLEQRAVDLQDSTRTTSRNITASARC